MRLAVIGTGAIGGYFGGRLAASGHDVTFVARGEHLAALRRDGLRVESHLGDVVLDPVAATDDATGIGPVDVVLVAVKTWQLDAVLPMLPSLVGEGSAVVTTQNGVEAPDRVAAVVGRDAVLPGVAKIIAWVDGPGRIAHRAGPATLAFAEWSNEPSDRVAREHPPAARVGDGRDRRRRAGVWGASTRHGGRRHDGLRRCHAGRGHVVAAARPARRSTVRARRLDR